MRYMNQAEIQSILQAQHQMFENMAKYLGYAQHASVRPIAAPDFGSPAQFLR